MKKYIIGVDIGGTKIASGIVTKSGKIIDKIIIPTLSSRGMKTSLKQVYISIRELIKSNRINKKDIIGIGVCAPGPLDPIKGVVHNPPNLRGWKEVPLVKLIKKEFGIKTRLENDANAAGMAEVIWGRAKKHKNVFYVTVSTGIGTGIIIDGKIYHGKNGMAGEGGHVTVNYDSKEKCNCGNIGCIEKLASGANTEKKLSKKFRKKITMIDVQKAANKGDKAALRAINDQAELIGVWLGSMVSLLDPEIIVIGGGVSNIGKLFFDPIKKTIPKHTINIYAKKTPVVRAGLKQDVGILGAASIFMEKK